MNHCAITKRYFYFISSRCWLGFDRRRMHTWGKSLLSFIPVTLRHSMRFTANTLLDEGMTWHVYLCSKLPLKPHTRTHERNGFPWDKRTSTQTCAEKCSAHWAVLSKAQEATPGKSLRQTSMTATAVLDTHTSCHLSLHISGLINNLCGFASCLFLSCGTKCLHMSVRAVCVVNKETGSPTGACCCVALRCC